MNYHFMHEILSQDIRAIPGNVIFQDLTPSHGKHERIKILRKKIEELKRRFPAHSVKPHMFLELENLQEELEQLLDGDDQAPGDRS